MVGEHFDEGQQAWLAGPTGLTWTPGGVPISRRFEDPYFSLSDGFEETKHVFLSGNDLPARLVPGFRIAELGFGTGLNLLATAQMLRDNGLRGPLYYTTFEAFPLSKAEAAAALSAFRVLDGPASELLEVWDDLGTRPVSLSNGLSLEVIVGDARQTLPQWAGQADAWFLDGFAPARNPELWEPSLLQAVARHTAPGGTAATYTAAGRVRRALDTAGFDVERVEGYGRKRHMTKARLR
ncbi:tRNA (5-methylaminomethyl-2-thiouridine)(34)-methyltransferase MnmD [Chachezhania sediminis]|uniref:tRNA (5-methylaminomethyl-2-thiouridine)(34)-methyltransferase MnmD n=1 Tax=Chachezhania sediminis TaxID=2599291 RepID=UPI001E4333ED|nr:tRNA (5-methylaminomethyl-2-thiouridine)(34)-methyltransferase MnmD [Chachezhania sediminis]